MVISCGARLIPNTEIRVQAVRYIVSGGILTVLYSVVYWMLAAPLRTPPLVANMIGFLCALICGWALHSRWTFRGQGDRAKRHVAYGRFVAVNLAGFGLNSFWVWMIVGRLGGDVALPILPIAIVTPAFMFLANRFWTFG
ncbi:GtrA family protein [Sphingomonas paeninsulae]|uniref:GtrA family protein n=1 Tax=Sphingomonas paeninsulae TaxID=2319844 RepID=A0A494T9G8_SPHPE|nr:GtrA family protein [Sphingomonas paeninsulae]